MIVSPSEKRIGLVVSNNLVTGLLFGGPFRILRTTKPDGGDYSTKVKISKLNLRPLPGSLKHHSLQNPFVSWEKS
jgi:hypothetical protein